MIDLVLQHRFDDFTLDVAFRAPRGVTALFGRSGAGKTTVINAIAGLLTPQAGHIRIEGTDILPLPPHKRRIGYVFQEARLFAHMSVKSNLLYGWRHRGGRGLPEAFEETITLLGIETLLARRPYALSGGEKQRVAIGRALLSDPALLLMDEPLAALDETRKAELLPYLERIFERSTLPVLYVSHSLAEITQLAQNIVLLDKGRTRAFGPLSALTSKPELAQLLGQDALAAILPARIGRSFDGLTPLETPFGALLVPRSDLPEGSLRALRIAAQDVIIARTPVQDLSALNVLPATLTKITDEGSGTLLLTLTQNGAQIFARISQYSGQKLALQEGQSVYAILKSVALTLAQRD